ncbi:vesicle-associated membrane protein 4-like [Amphibalanus amphitrite]|uniref:vesicle-associated membrane protein 4-like n=1 Tax=Amphibalanus amphitrite TaxID=1232801 RepID=UPI001C914806|nr:vesicle-associated membrane protein 4-like [Amphibalanus amphitrite]
MLPSSDHGVRPRTRHLPAISPSSRTMQPRLGSKVDLDDYEAADDSERAGLLGAEDGSRGDDFFLRGPQPGRQRDSVAAVREQVSEVTGIMRQNVEKIVDRGANLSQLEEQSEHLASTSDDFYISSRQVQRRMYLRDLKMKIALAAVILILMLIIILPIVLKS